MKNKAKIVIVFILGMFVATIGTYCATTSLYKAEEVSYDKTDSGGSYTNVQDSIDELYKNFITLNSTGDATAEDILSGKTALVKGELVTGTYVASSGTGSPLTAASWYNYGGSGCSGAVDTGDSTNKKAFFAYGTRSGSGGVGYGQGSNNGSSWTTISTGIYTYRYYRSCAYCTNSSSSISAGFIGVINLGYE